MSINQTLVNPKYLRPVRIRECYSREIGENRYHCPANGKVLYVRWGRDELGANAMFTVNGPGSTVEAGVQCQAATRDSFLSYNGKDPDTEPRPVYRGGGKGRGKKITWAGIVKQSGRYG